MDTGRAPPIEMSLDAHAGCLSFEFSSPKQSLIVVNCGMPADRARELAAARARHRGAFDGDVQRHVLGALRRIGDVPPRARRLADAGRTAATSSVTREDATDAIVLRAAHDGYADRFGIVHERVADRWRRDGTRLDGEDIFLAADGGTQLRSRARRIRRPLSPASDGEGDPAHRRPRRHADDAEQGSVDLQRPRGPRRARGQRLSRRQRRPAPHRADRHPRPCPHRLARAMEPAARQSGAAPARAARARRSRGCRCEFRACSRDATSNRLRILAHPWRGTMLRQRNAGR